MVTAIIQINTERSAINDVADKLTDMKEITEVFSVSGKFDLVAIARISSNEELSNLVTKKLCSIESIIKTETMLAFQAFSKHDLEAMFSIGNQ